MQALILLLKYLATAIVFLHFGNTSAQTGSAQSRNTLPKVALILGNGNYSQPGFQLKNPVSDADLMAKSLRKLGFDVHTEVNLGRGDMLRAIADFSAKVPQGATTFLYYAGHGMQIGGTSYLIPTDMEVTTEQKVPLRSVSLNMILDSLSASRAAVNIVVLDACRNNPFSPAKLTRYRGAETWGLSSVKAPRGTLVAYSTSPNQLAPDGNDSHSVYTKLLAEALLEPGATLIDTFKRVGEKVRKTTMDDQIPWFATSLVDDYFFIPPVGTTMVAGQSLQRAVGGNNAIASRSFTTYPNIHWYQQLNEYEWSELDWEINQRVKHLTVDEIPKLERQAKGGSVVAQTTLGIAWREGIQKSSSSRGLVMRNQANNGKAIYWLSQAVNGGFAIAQAEMGEMYYMGHGVQRDKEKGRMLLNSAAQFNYPRAQLDLVQMRIESGEASSDELINVLDSVMRSTNKGAMKSRQITK